MHDRHCRRGRVHCALWISFPFVAFSVLLALTSGGEGSAMQAWRMPLASTTVSMIVSSSTAVYVVLQVTM